MPKEEHAYLKTHRLAGAMIALNLNDETAKLRERAAAGANGRSAKTLVKEGRLRVTLVALQRTRALDAHHVDAAISVQVLRGRCEVMAGGHGVTIGAGQLAVIDDGVEHSVRAIVDSVLLITVAMSL